MKNFSFDDLADTTFPFPVSSFLYRDTGVPVLDQCERNKTSSGPSAGE
jgi:hypothetical protein